MKDSEKNKFISKANAAIRKHKRDDKSDAIKQKQIFESLENLLREYIDNVD